MTIELTHTQAAILRAINSDAWEARYIGSPLIGSDDFSWAIERLEVGAGYLWTLTNAGQEALAAYDAKWVPVEKWRLEEVANYVSECTPLTSVSDEEIVADVVARAHCEIMLTGIGMWGEPTDGSKEVKS
jgi:hypothetical protein